jgi:hypothetical protein
VPFLLLPSRFLQHCVIRRRVLIELCYGIGSEKMQTFSLVLERLFPHIVVHLKASLMNESCTRIGN